MMTATDDPGRVLVLGAGPTGLGAAYRLQEAGHRDFTILEASDRPGGLATSVRDEAGFVWDVGGHVHFSHYAYYDAVFERALEGRFLEHRRESRIWTKERFVPYPFQDHIHLLDAEDRERALQGLEAVTSRAPDGSSRQDFRRFIATTFGSGIAELFMLPYNEKVWGYPLETLSADWIAERVAVPDLERLRAAVAGRAEPASWGPNQTFRYPLEGGTGALWQGVAALIADRHLELRARAVAVDAPGRRVRLADGRSFAFETLITSIPLDRFCAICHGLDAEVVNAALGLTHSSSHLLGFGLRGGQPEPLETLGWIYFPAAETPHYRVTVLSNYSPRNAPEGCWSLLAEVSETPVRPVDARRLPDEVLAALRADHMVLPEAEVSSQWQRREEHGYPTPTLDRDRRLARVLPALEAHRIYSRGRFGAWRYEVSNQDHSFMQGVELVERLLGLGEETTLSGR